MRKETLIALVLLAELMLLPMQPSLAKRSKTLAVAFETAETTTSRALRA